MKTDQYGRVELTEQEAFDALYSGKISSLENLYLVDQTAIDQYNHARDVNADRIPVLEKLQELDIPVEAWDQLNHKDWFMPKDAVQENLVEMLYGMCSTAEQTDRVSKELELFIKHNMMDLLYYLKYLVDTLRANNVLWGVGRGSSVASYVLYLIGIHKVDSMKYELDIHEFLK